jgi:hypothetical protein
LTTGAAPPQGQDITSGQQGFFVSQQGFGQHGFTSSQQGFTVGQQGIIA